MEKDLYSDEVLKQYLLGKMSDEERERIERRYLADKEFLDQLLAIEDDLVDEYVRGELSASEREQFERKLGATPDQTKETGNGTQSNGRDGLAQIGHYPREETGGCEDWFLA